MAINQFSWPGQKTTTPDSFDFFSFQWERHGNYPGRSHMRQTFKSFPLFWQSFPMFMWLLAFCSLAFSPCRHVGKKGVKALSSVGDQIVSMVIGNSDKNEGDRVFEDSEHLMKPHIIQWYRENRVCKASLRWEVVVDKV